MSEQVCEGVIQTIAGSYEVQCCCGEWKALEVDISEIPEQDYQHYCGGSPRCCP